MLSRRAKAAFFALASPLMRINAALYRRWRAPRRGPLEVQLGPGQRNYIAGWINVDANIFTARCDVWADLRHPLPLHDATVAALYSHHVVEHLPDLAFHFRDAYRCLEPGGIYRVGGPNGDGALRKYLAGDVDWFSDFPECRRSVGGRLDNFIFCRREHLAILTFSYLQELMGEAGFESIRACLPVRESAAPERFERCLALEHETDWETPHTLIVEGRRPR